MRFILIFLLFTSSVLSAEKSKKIVFIAGADSHGHGEHEFRAGCHLLAKCLNKSGLDVHAEVVEEGWPKDESVLKGAASIIIFSNGRKEHPLLGKFEFFDELVNNGTGVGFFHDAFNVETEAEAAYVKKWIGGHYERGFSTNPKWECKALLNRESAITGGVQQFKLFDEWHFNIKFDESVKIVKVFSGAPDEAARSGASSSPRGPFPHIVNAKDREEVLLWLKEGKSRGVGFSGGHFHQIWKNKHLRTLVLNAIVWSAGIEVPRKGVKSENPTALELSYRMSPSPEEVIWEKEIVNLKDARLKFKSRVLKGRDKEPYVEKEIDISGAKELSLMVLDGGNGIFKDHCAWLDPVLVMEDGSTKSLTSLNWEVGITGWREIKINQGVELGKMELLGKEVQGISTHALSIIRYKLPEKVKFFKTKMALLDSNEKSGSVQFEIYVK